MLTHTIVSKQDLTDASDSAQVHSASQAWTGTDSQARAYQLLHIFLHELGHHHDRMTTKRQLSTSRGEPYAEAYARRHEGLIWDRYLKVFGLD